MSWKATVTLQVFKFSFQGGWRSLKFRAIVSKVGFSIQHAQKNTFIRVGIYVCGESREKGFLTIIPPNQIFPLPEGDAVAFARTQFFLNPVRFPAQVGGPV